MIPYPTAEHYSCITNKHDNANIIVPAPIRVSFISSQYSHLYRLEIPKAFDLLVFSEAFRPFPSQSRTKRKIELKFLFSHFFVVRQKVSWRLFKRLELIFILI